MDPRHNEFAPFNTSFANSPRFPNRPPIYGGGRGGMRRSRRRSQPPVLPYPQIPLTRQPMGFPVHQPLPSFGSPPPMSPAPSGLPCCLPANDVMNVLLTDYMDPDKIFYVYNENDLEIIFRDSGDEKISGGENMTGDTSGHSEFGLSDPNHGKRILANDEEAYACSNAKKARRSEELDENEQIEQLTREDPRLKLATGEVSSDDSLK